MGKSYRAAKYEPYKSLRCTHEFSFINTYRDTVEYSVKCPFVRTFFNTYNDTVEYTVKHSYHNSDHGSDIIANDNSDIKPSDHTNDEAIWSSE